MASRFGHSTLHQRDSRSALFEGYSGSGRNSADPARRPSPAPGGYGYGYPGGSNGAATGGSSTHHLGVDSRGNYRPATPNSRGQYSDAVLNELESQNDQQVEGILGKVKILKDVSFVLLLMLRIMLTRPYPGPKMTSAIGDEIRESSALAEKMNDTFDSTRLRLRGTMNRMLVMAERTGVGWKVWLAFFAAVIFIFLYVWLF
ncbi:Protein transport protein bet1 [Daldinia childiae]|uniref:Protein transport protein bet1 n=1 Tax=Daldinia childiae TaxID=326645 RepID=UPI0014481166|nr:Protein transport protein bet1 [Daldinia childiae]KAF3071193.1 Protein transport protein bet1 [Daldinia childiae]